MIGAPRVDKFSRLEIKPIVKVNGYPKMYEANLTRPMSLVEKRQDVESRLAGTEFVVNEIKSLPYREIYLIHCPSGDYRFDTVYNKSLIFNPFTSVSKGPDVDVVLDLLNSSCRGKISVDYMPSSDGMLSVYELVKSACESGEVTIVDVTEFPEAYKVVYCLETDGKSYLDVFLNSKGFVTSLIPHSTFGQNDLKLKNILDEIDGYAKSK